MTPKPRPAHPGHPGVQTAPKIPPDATAPKPPPPKPTPLPRYRHLKDRLGHD
jgi:hypothetical protein